MFWNTKKLNSEEYEKLSKKITELNSKIDDLANKFDKHKILFDSLRGLVNRKIHKLKDEDEEDLQTSETDQQETLNTSVILPEDGNIKRNRKGSV